MVEVPVHNLTLEGPYAKPTGVKFSLWPNLPPTCLPLGGRAVASRDPLKVRVTVPPGCRISGWRKYEGDEIILVHS
jgi:hypothetical protein